MFSSLDDIQQAKRMVVLALQTVVKPQSAICDTIWVDEQTTLATLLAQTASVLGATSEELDLAVKESE